MVITYGDCSATVPDAAIVVESTGLKDKNGVEIYEDYILKHEHCPGVFYCRVVFVDGAFMVTYPRGRWDDEFLFEIADDCEVIGNVYQRPDWETWHTE